MNVQIKNFKGIKRCPYCNRKPETMRWDDGKLSISCKNPDCNLVSNEFTVEYTERDISLQKLTRKLIEKWNEHCVKGKKKTA